MLGQSNVEIQMKRVYAVSRATVFLPFTVEDAARSEAEVEASQVRYITSTPHRLPYSFLSSNQPFMLHVARTKV